MNRQHPIKIEASRLARQAVRRGVLPPPVQCERCNVSGRRLHMHHPDYSKPLEVVVLCVPCHMRVHGRLSEGELIAAKLTRPADLKLTELSRLADHPARETQRIVSEAVNFELHRFTEAMERGRPVFVHSPFWRARKLRKRLVRLNNSICPRVAEVARAVGRPWTSRWIISACIEIHVFNLASGAKKVA